MSHVLIAHAGGDGDEAATLAHILRRSGRHVKTLAQDEHAHLPSETAEIPHVSEAAGVLVCWSSNCASAPALLALAESATRPNKLLVVRLDAAPPPVLAAPVFEIEAGAGKMSQSQADAFLAAVATLAGPAPRPPALQASMRPPRKPPWRLLAACGLAFLLAAGAGGAWFALRGSDAAPLLSAAASGGAASPASAVRSDETLALEAWGATSRTDALALRQYLSRFPQSSQAEAARAALLRLDHQAWNAIAQGGNADERLRTLAAYRSNFPGGAHAAEAVAAEAEARDMVGAIQALLTDYGFDPGPADGVSRPQTLKAVAAYQASVGLPQTGLIDAGLLEGLRAKSASAGKSPASGAPPTASPGAAASAPPSPTAAAASSPALTATQSRETAKPFRDCYVCPELVALPQGAYEMGSVAGASDGDERPVHRVVIAYRLAVGRSEVTFDEWDACISDGGCSYRPADMGWGRGARPVINIGSGDIAAYLAWLQRKTGKRYRLLSEAEWEYAARAGSRSDYDFGGDRADLCRHGNGADQSTDYSWRNQACTDGYAKLTAPVRSFEPNAWGLYDTIGNVWEWTSDCWHDSYAGAPGDGSAWTTACAKPDRILRGGAFSVDPDKLRVSYRYSFGPERMPFFGFRVARVMDE